VFAVGKSASDTGVASSIDLSGLNSSDIISLFSEYRILSVTVNHMLVSAPNNASASFPRLHIAPRGFSNTTPISRNEVLQYNGVKMYQYGPANLEFKQTFTPYVWLDAVGGATGKKLVKSPWIATDSDLVRHNTAVLWIDRYNTTTDNFHTLEAVIDVVLECRGPR
jgi:hypothetical protein